jgi:hypothetical protein
MTSFQTYKGLGTKTNLGISPVRSRNGDDCSALPFSAETHEPEAEKYIMAPVDGQDEELVFRAVIAIYSAQLESDQTKSHNSKSHWGCGARSQDRLCWRSQRKIIVNLNGKIDEALESGTSLKTLLTMRNSGSMKIGVTW